jgi:phosphinothricin acetyltransferase
VNPLIRAARPEDIPTLNAIYGHYVEGCTCTWEEADARLFSREGLARREERYPVLVAEIGGEIRGWGSLSPYNLRSGWRFVAENSVFIDHRFHGKGLGKALLAALLDRARSGGVRKVIARISGDQLASLGLHRAMGYREVGRLREAGFKSGKWLDCVYMERDLGTTQP